MNAAPSPRHWTTTTTTGYAPVLIAYTGECRHLLGHPIPASIGSRASETATAFSRLSAHLAARLPFAHAHLCQSFPAALPWHHGSDRHRSGTMTPYQPMTSPTFEPTSSALPQPLPPTTRHPAPRPEPPPIHTPQSCPPIAVAPVAPIPWAGPDFSTLAWQLDEQTWLGSRISRLHNSTHRL
jgi:hypothetical protein